jgi:hypothetical protein
MNNSASLTQIQKGEKAKAALPPFRLLVTVLRLILPGYMIVLFENALFANIYDY